MRKVKKSILKRFKITKTGKVMHSSQNVGHLRRKKNSRQKRRQAEPAQLSKAFAKKVKQMLGAA